MGLIHSRFGKFKSFRTTWITMNTTWNCQIFESGHSLGLAIHCVGWPQDRVKLSLPVYWKTAAFNRYLISFFSVSLISFLLSKAIYQLILYQFMLWFDIIAIESCLKVTATAAMLVLKCSCRKKVNNDKSFAEKEKVSKFVDFFFKAGSCFKN